MLEDSEAKAIVIHADLLGARARAIPDGVHVLVVRTPPEVLEAYGIRAERGEVPAGATDWDGWRDGFEPRMARAAWDEAVDHLHVGDDRTSEGRQASRVHGRGDGADHGRRSP